MGPAPGDKRSGCSGSGVELSLHAMLRRATNDVHQRLHRHPGFAAVQNETITLNQYGSLLGRLHSFHLAFEQVTEIAPVRSERLAVDLTSLGRRSRSVDQNPCMPDLPTLADGDTILGACYVLEGAALGGRTLARHLDGLLGAGTTAGRTFLRGDGAETGAVWRNYLVRLAAVSNDLPTRRRVSTAAVATFAAFEVWLRDWDQTI